MMASPNDPSPGSTTQSPEDLWKRALENLKANTKLSIDLTSTDRREILEEVLLIVQTTERDCQHNRWKWKNKRGETVILRDVFVKMVRWIEKFKGIGDTIVQYDPGHAALPWAAARFVLQAAINDVQTNGAMLEGLELVFSLIAKFEVVERLYLRRTSSLQQRLADAIIAAYTSIMEFLLEANEHFAQSTTIRIAKSIFQLEETTVKYISKIKKNATEVEEFVRLVSGEVLSNTETSVTKLIDNLSVLDTRSKALYDIDVRTQSIQTTIDNDLEALQNILKEFDQPITRIATQISAIEDNLREDDRLKVFGWLTAVPYPSHHRSKVKSLLPGSGQWLLQNPRFVDWMSFSTSSILWLHGIPGSGKSMLVAQVIEYIQSRISAGSGLIPLAYFYCARTNGEPERSDPVEILRSIIEQLSCSDADLPILLPVAERYRAKKKEARGRKPEKLELSECKEVILELLETNPAVIIIDALDECDPARRQDLLDILGTIIKEASNVLQVFVSSRDDHDLVHRLSNAPNLYIRAADNTPDIERFVVSSVDEAIKKERILCGRVSNELRTEIIQSLKSKAKGMFRLASLHIESLCNPAQIKTKANVLDALTHLPRDLKVSYDSVLANILNSQYPNPELASRIFKWLLCAPAYLSPSQFIMAVSWDMNDHSPLESSDILSICCNLVVYDEETRKFRFAHLSVQEYLEHLENFSPEEYNALAAEQCLAWLLTNGYTSINGVRRAARKPGKAPSFYGTLSRKFSDTCIYFFSKHVDVFWSDYAQRAGGCRTRDRLNTLIQKFLLFEHLVPRDSGQQFIAWHSRINEIARRERHLDHSSSRYVRYILTLWPRDPNPLALACVLNFPEIMTAFINGSASVNATDDTFLSLVALASELNRREILEVLLNECQRFESAESCLRIAIIGAAKNYYVETLEALLVRAGAVFVTVADIVFILKLLQSTIPTYDYLRPNKYRRTLQLLFENSIEPKVAVVPSSSIYENDENTTAQEHVNAIQKILKKARSIGIPVNTDLLSMFANKITKQFVLTLEILEKIMETEKAGALLLVVLEQKLQIGLSALDLLLSVVQIRKVLAFGNIIVNDSAVRGTIINFEHVEKYLRSQWLTGVGTVTWWPPTAEDRSGSWQQFEF